MPKDKEKKEVVQGAVVAPRPERFRVVVGKSVVCKRGVLSGDDKDTIEPGDLSGGKEALDALVERGYVEKYK